MKMARSSPFIFYIILPILFIFVAVVLYKQHQLSSSFSVQLHQLNSRVSVLESIIEKNHHEWRSKEDDIAQIKKIILEEKESIVSLHNKIHSPSTQELIPDLKNQLLTFISNLKPHFDFVTAKTNEAYNASKNTTAESFQEWYKSAKPNINRIASVIKKYLGG